MNFTKAIREIRGVLLLIPFVIRFDIFVFRHQLVPIFRQLDLFGDKLILEKPGSRAPQQGYKRARPAGNHDHEAAVEVDFRRT